MPDADRHAPASASDLGPLLARLRTDRGLTQKELAEQAGCSPSTINRIERSGRGISRELADRIVAVLGATSAERVELLQAAGMLDDETAGLLESPALTRFSRVLAVPEMRREDRALLLKYVELALAHADALGYLVPPAWPANDDDGIGIALAETDRGHQPDGPGA